MKNTVYIEKMSQASGPLEEQFVRAFAAIGLYADHKKAKAIFIKPNLTYPYYKEGVTTRPEFVRALVHSLCRINDKTRIYIGEGEGGYNSFSMTEAFKNMGYFELEKEFPQVKILNLSKMASREVAVSISKGTVSIPLPGIFFDEIDFSISCPVPKIHCMTGVSLSYKNQWGCIPDTMRLRLHHVFDEVISKISDVLKFKYALLDGKFALDINGPMAGKAVETDWFAAADSPGALDLVVSEMMGFDWKKIRHLNKARIYGLLPDRKDVNIIGDTASLKRNFTLKRDIWNYPALAAFHSSSLTRLFYFSKLAKPLHDIMYTFRKRAIDK